MKHPQHGKGPSQRQLRVGEELRHVLAQILERGDVHDSELASMTITVTEVRVSPDLRNATAFVTPLGGGDPEAALAALRRNKPHLRHQVAQRMRQLKYVPDLSFQPDTSFEYARRIDQLLHDPRVLRDLPGDGQRRDDEDGDA